MTTAAPPARGGGRARSGPLKLIAVIAVIALFLLAIPAAIDWTVGPAPHSHDGEDAPDEDTHGASITTITGEETWTDLNEVLETRIHLQMSANLRIERCDLTILFEDLLVRKDAWFKVTEGAHLEVVDSTIRVKVAPQLDRAVMSVGHHFNDFYDREDRLDGQFAYLSRTLNLRYTESPVLSFNVSWRGAPSDLVVAGEANPSSPIMVLDFLEAPEPTHGEWLHYEVDLSALVGGAPRVSISPAGGEHHALLISDLRVLDGGRTPRGDSFPTGIATEDGWESHGFEPAIREAYHSSELPSLISGGQVSIVRSALLAPDDIPRWSEITSSDLPTDLELERDRSLSERSRGLDIDVRNERTGEIRGVLDVIDSIIEHVPIGVTGAPVNLSGSTFVGSTDLLTMYTCHGSVVGCRFVTATPSEEPVDPEDPRVNRDFGWAVACQQMSGSSKMVFEYDRFSGSEVALVLNDANAEVEGCMFDSVSGICVWDHETRGVDGWGTLSVSNTFARCTGDLYMQSHDCALSFRGQAYDPHHTDGFGDGGLGDESAVLLPSMAYVFADTKGGLLYLPTELVEGNGTVHLLDNVSIWLYTDWSGHGDFEVSTQSTTFLAYFVAEEEEYDELDIYFKIYPPLGSIVTHGQEVGDAVISIYLDTSIVLAIYELSALRLQLRIDGSLVEESDVLHPAWAWPEPGLISYNLTLPKGATVVNTSLEGDVVGGQSGLPIYNDTYSVLRVSNSTPHAQVAAFLGAGGHFLLLDPDVELSLDDLPVVPDFDYSTFDEVPTRTLRADLCEGSRLVVSGGDVRQDESVRLVAFGNGTVEASGFECAAFRATANGPSLTLSDVGCREMYLTGSSWLYEAPVAIRGSRVSVSERFDLSGMEGCSLVLEDSDIALDYRGELGCPNGSAKYVGTTVRALEPTGIDVLQASLTRLPPQELSFQYCRFENVTLRIGMWPLAGSAPRAIAIEGCTFAGGSAYLVMEDQPDTVEGHPWPSWLTVVGNEFDGVGAGLVATQGMVARAMSTSLFTDGATAWAAYPFYTRLGSEFYPWAQALPPFSWRSQTLLQVGGLFDLVETHLLLDVTGDPGEAASPGTVDLIVGMGRYEPVRGFASVDALSGGFDGQPPSWADAGPLLIELIYNILDGTGFWT